MDLELYACATGGFGHVDLVKDILQKRDLRY